MKLLGTGIKLNKRQLKFLLFILFLGVLCGFLFYIKVDSSVFIKQIQEIDINLQSSHVNFIINHILVLFFLLSTSFSIIGIILFLLYVVWEVTCISYSSFVFMNAFGFSGLIYGIIYNLVIKFFFLFSLFVIFKKVYFIFKNKFFNKDDQEQQMMHFSFKKKNMEIIICCICIILYDIFLYFLGSQILLKLTFLL